MNILFDKNLDNLPTSKDKLLEVIIKEITQHIEQNRLSKRGVEKKTRHDEYLIVSKIIDALYQGYYSIPQSWISLSLKAKHYSKKEYGYKNIKKVVDALKDKDFIKIKLGNEYAGKVTRIFPSDILVAKFKRIGFRWRYYPPDKKTEVILVKDKIKIDNKLKKVTVPTPNNKQVKQHRENLIKINNELAKHCIALDLDDKALSIIDKKLIENTKKKKKGKSWKKEIHHSLNFSNVTLKRIFSNNSLEIHGRFYHGWWQTVPKQYRPHITIDGYKTAEVDFSTIALKLLYAKEDIVVPDNRDLHDIGLEGSETYLKRARELVKKYTYAVINNEKSFYRLDKSELKELKLTHQQLQTKVNEHHKPIIKYFGTGIGVNLMYTDSVIAEDVMLSFLKQGIIVLPIHDSFIIRSGYQLSLEAQMKASFNKIVHATTNLKAKGPLLPEHFYLKPKTESGEVILNTNQLWELVQNNDSKFSIYNKYLSYWHKWNERQ